MPAKVWLGAVQVFRSACQGAGLCHRIHPGAGRGRKETGGRTEKQNEKRQIKTEVNRGPRCMAGA
nr:MAG TPA_asm: hypothetical protein [Caudoviricetes sp.]